MPPGPFLRNKRNSQLLIRAIGIIARHIEKWGWRDHPKTPQSSGPVAAHRHDKSTNGKHHHPPRHVAHPIFSWSGHLCPTEYRLALDSSSTKKSRGQQDEKARAAASSSKQQVHWGALRVSSLRMSVRTPWGLQQLWALLWPSTVRTPEIRHPSNHESVLEAALDDSFKYQETFQRSPSPEMWSCETMRQGCGAFPLVFLPLRIFLSSRHTAAFPLCSEEITRLWFDHLS